MRRNSIILSATTLVIVGGIVLPMAWSVVRPVPGDRLFRGAINDAQRLPLITPDYSDITIPPNIAPLNFAVREEGTQFACRISAPYTQSFVVRGKGNKILIPERGWRQLLQMNRGTTLSFELFALNNGVWHRFKPIVNTVASDPIDPYLVYRLIPPIHNTWYEMRIFQRCVENFRETPIYFGRPSVRMRNVCVNCHSFPERDPSRMLMHTRGDVSTTLLAGPDGVSRVDMSAKMVYVSWHPNRRVIAFSTNRVRQFFHITRAEIRDVLDEDSDLGLYLVDSCSFLSDTSIAQPNRLETYPCWAPDGKTLYFSSAPKLLDAISEMETPVFRDIKYDLMKVSYDPSTHTFGTPQTVLSARQTGMSIVQPRASPDGKFLLFCMCPYGCFPIYQPESDLYLMDIHTGAYWKLPVNSDESDSWHSWSSNGRWFVFSSKRDNGLFARPYLCHIDMDGSTGKPFLLPQKNPSFYDAYLFTVNVPEFCSGPVKFSETVFNRAIEQRGREATNLSPSILPRKGGDAMPWRKADR